MVRRFAQRMRSGEPMGSRETGYDEEGTQVLAAPTGITRRRMLPLFAGLVASLLAAVSVGAEETLPRGTTIDGGSFGARLVAVDASWQLTFAEDAEQRQVPASELVFWGRLHEAPSGTRLLLPGRGVVLAEVLRGGDEVLEVESLVLREPNGTLGKLSVPLEMLAGIYFQPPADALQRDRVALDVWDAEPGTDRLLLDNGDELTGLIARLNASGVQFEAEVGEVSIEAERLVALSFDAQLRHVPQTEGQHAMVGFRDGSRLLASSLIVADGDAKVTLPGGIEWHTGAEEIVYVQPLGGAATYVSDLEPESYRHIPFLRLGWPYGLDRNVQGGHLRSGGEIHLKGVGMHSAARLTWNVAGRYRRFDAEIALDDAAGAQGSVTFRVFADGTEKYASPVVRGGDAPLPISVDVTGATRVSLIVDFADRGDEMDHANWLNARLLP